MSEERLFTANRFVAIPDISKSRCGILDISFVSMLYRAVVELHGTEDNPFLEPVISISGSQVDLANASWEHEMNWIPSFSLKERGLEVKSRIFPALAHRGFVWLLEFNAESDDRIDVEVGWKGHWIKTSHVVNISKPIRGERVGSVSEWHKGVPCIEFRGVTPMFAIAFCPSEEMQVEISSDREPDRIVSNLQDGEVEAAEGERISYRLSLPLSIQPGERRAIALYVGLGPEETSAISSAVDLKRHGWDGILDDLTQWLESHRLSVDDKQLENILNTNSLYNFFFSEAFTMDTEELVLLAARSSKYHVSAAYWDRDAMLWSLPSVLQIEPVQARNMIEYAFTMQLRNVGVHSRFVDGVALEPGFELDELCAPIRALSTYVRVTGDTSILFDRRVQAGVNRIRKILGARKHPSIALFETMLLPSDSVAMYPYVTYDNVLAWRVLRDLEWMYELIHDLDRSEEHKQLAKQVHRAIIDNCVVEGPFGPMFAWAVDLDGNHQLYDEPSGSLQLLSWLEFCLPDSSAYQNTVKWIHSAENPYSFYDSPFGAPGSEYTRHPTILSVANDLLTGREEQAFDFLRRTAMDDGIACESVDEVTGRMASGPAFAACAGYLAFALGTALGARMLGPLPEPGERLYEPPPPEIRDRIESGGLH